ncbi:hypothetical protein PANO111632_04230 [Paracoccus nototheniae]|uniref:Cellulose-binding protein n=1 Tax=Paracoccus nototheniae TaxID=2489002 RepID=A0ABW4DWJ3_9RHOB|nr:hypothetical protein [Paracoccus nototheniae]
MKRRSLLLLGAAACLPIPVAVLGRGGAALAQGTGAAGPVPVAVGLSGIADWEAAQPFIDVFRHSREWMGRRPDEFVSHTHAQLAEGGHLDEGGWPVSIPDDATSVGTVILCDLAADDTSLSGHYRMTWDGAATVAINGTCTNVTQGEGWAEFDYETSDSGIVVVDLSDLAPGNPARNFRCIHASLQAAHDDGQIFRPVWLDLIRSFGVIRFMDWMATNNSTVSDWSDRPTLTSATWTFGVPVEVMVTLANDLGVDPWFCFPHLATDDYITRFASYVRDNLDPGLRAYYEYSNEVWNFQFEQCHWALQQAEALWPGQGDGWMQVYGGKSADMAVLLDAVYGCDASRYRKVITAHTAWIDLNHSALDAPLWVAAETGRQPPKTHFDAYAVTGYFDGGLGRPANVPLIQSWREMGEPQAFALMAEQVLDGRHVSGEEAGTTMDGLQAMWEAQKAIADDAGLALVMYEGGSHVTPDHDALEADPGLLNFYTRFHYSDQMGQLYTQALTRFAEAGGEFFNVFVEVAGPGRAGFWGARRHVMDDNPRWNAIIDYNATTTRQARPVEAEASCP